MKQSHDLRGVPRAGTSGKAEEWWQLSRAKRKEAKQRGLFCGTQGVTGKKRQRERSQMRLAVNRVQ